MEFIAKGRLTLEGVTFYIEARDLDDAKEQARNGRFEHYEIDATGIEDADIRVSSIARNE
jgi:hypothetical protein